MKEEWCADCVRFGCKGGLVMLTNFGMTKYCPYKLERHWYNIWRAWDKRTTLTPLPAKTKEG